MMNDSSSPAGACTLILSVGTGSTRRDIAEALLFSIRQHQADRLVFLCSAKTCKETLPLVLEKLQSDGWTPDQRTVHICSDEDDVQALFVEWNRAWDRWFADRPTGQIIVDFTSGTKPMSAAAAMLGISRGVETLSYVVGVRDQTGRVIQSTGVRALTPDLVLAHRRLRLAVEHFHAGSFAAAADLAGRHLKIAAMPDDDLREKARSVHFLACACEAWDRFSYKQAAGHLRDAARYWNNWPWVRDPQRLANVHSLIVAARDACKSESPNAALAADLLASADRCIARQDWDDTVARLYRACEMLAQLRLLKEYGQKTGDIDPEKLPEALREEYRQRRQRAEGGNLKLGLAEAFTLLERLGDPLGLEFRVRYGRRGERGELQGLLNARNDSLLAHGSVPIKEDAARRLREHVLALADIADPDIRGKWLPMARLPEFGEF